MTNGAMNVEIGNPTYKMYEGEPDDDVGELLDADFTLDPDKVKLQIFSFNWLSIPPLVTIVVWLGLSDLRH